MTSKYFFSLEALRAQISDGGSIIDVTSDQAPGFVNISFSQLKLSKKGLLEPIWHPNAQKIGYCMQGNALVSIRTPGSNELFTIEKGDVFFIPQGFVHHIENCGNDEVVVNFAYNHSKPEVMRLSKAVFSISDSVFASTFNTPSSFFEGLRKNQSQGLITTLAKEKAAPDFISSRYKFNIGSSAKPILTKGGYLELATKSNLPVLNGLAILGFGLNPKGIVEPHWHTNAGELVYIVKGKTKITVLSPDGKVEVLEVNGGQGAFAPASHFHNIENIGTEPVEVIAYFSNEDPNYMGIGEILGSYSNEVLGSVFNVDPTYFNSFKKPESPLVIVPI